MKRIISGLFLIVMFFGAGRVWAVPSAPVLSADISGMVVTLQWNGVSGATGYILYYAPYPDASAVYSLDLGSVTQVGFSLWAGAGFYTAIQAYDTSGSGDYSNIETIVIDTYPVVDTGQSDCYDEKVSGPCPSSGQSFYGQDSQYSGNLPSYTDNGDGTVTDNVTGLMWQQDFSQVDWTDAAAGAAAAATGGYTDWRVPTIKELYSLVDFTGQEGMSNSSDPLEVPSDAAAFIDTDYFSFEYGQVDRYIDAQYVSSTEYVSTVMAGKNAFFGLNLADGRIKGYGQNAFFQDGTPRYYARYVRGNTAYGINDFQDNGDDTISDNATGLMWARVDSGDAVFASDLSGLTNSDGSMNWEEALAFAEAATLAGHSDWRLPNAKELHSIVDYTRSPDTTGSAAIDPLFDTTGITNEGGQADFPFFWSSTSFNPGGSAVYIAFGRALGLTDLGSGDQYYDVHGAGAQRTDPKQGSASAGNGPQGDVQRVYNYVRLVRDID